MKKIFFLVSACWTISSMAYEISFINSDVARYKKDSIECEGNVVIVYDKKIITANKISYDKKNETVHASENVHIKDELGNVYFADEIVVSKNFSKGHAKNIKIIMADKTRLAATFARIKNGIYELKNVIYSPCYVCNKHGDVTWQIKSQHVDFDPHDMTQYKNAKFELFGNPILYTPYFAHENSLVKYKSGLLPPKLATSSANGLVIVPQYLWAISHSQEMVFKPIITTKAGTVLWGEYTYRFRHGELKIDTSITGTESVKDFKTDDKDTKKKIDKIKHNHYRGHFFATINYEINDTWRSGADLKLVSDQFYLKRFPFLPYQGRTLESNARLERFYKNDYTLIKIASFQTEDLNNIPKILPLIEHSYSKELFNGIFSVNILGMNLEFNESRAAQKIITNLSWERSLMLPLGQILQIKGIASVKGMSVNEKKHSQYNSDTSLVPQVSCVWSWPLLVLGKNITNIKTIFTPIAGIVISGNKKFQDIFEYPFAELNALNLFTGNRSISSYDIDSGRRICYGARMSGYYNGYNIYQFVIGQSTELSKPQNNIETTGLKNKHSNTLIGLDLFPTQNLTLITRASYDHHDQHWTKIESGVKWIYKKVDFDVMMFNGRHNYYDPFDDNVYKKPQEISKYKGTTFVVGYQATPKVRFYFGADIGNAHKTENDNANSGKCQLIRQKFGLEYRNECTEFRCEIARKRFHSGDLRPETSIKMYVHLKNLGI